MSVRITGTMSHTFLVGRDSVVLDIGANQGFYSMLAAAHGCRVVSFEPRPVPARAARRTRTQWLYIVRARNGFAYNLNLDALMYTPFASGGRTERLTAHSVTSTTVGEVLPPATSVRLAKVDVRRGG